VVLNVARQYPRKDTRSLLAAVPRLRARHPDLTVRVVGGGPELPRLAALVERLGIGAGVRLLGPLPTDEAVRQEYRDATVFCLASRQEGFGMVLLEAMAAGLPIVACRSGAVPEVVTDGETALLVPPGDPEALAEALLALLADPDRRRRMAEAGRERARRHDWPRVAADFLERVT
jgi:glycosyltransferase involved in cell wall biosynthesis